MPSVTSDTPEHGIIESDGTCARHGGPYGADPTCLNCTIGNGIARKPATMHQDRWDNLRHQANKTVYLTYRDSLTDDDEELAYADALDQCLTADLTPRRPGQVVTDHGRMYRTDGATSWVKVSEDSPWQVSTAPLPPHAVAVTTTTAALHGAATGRCLACNRPIRDAAKGFGPKCAQRFA